MKPDDRRDPADLAIDRAVRDMMSAEPRPGMRQRVLARIQEPERRMYPLLKFAVAGISIALVVGVALRIANRPEIAVTRSTTPPRSSPVVKSAPPTSTPSTATPSIETAAIRELAPLAPPGLVVAQSLAEAVEPTEPIEALQAPAAVTVSTIESGVPTRLSDIIIEGIAIKSLQVAPLTALTIDQQ